jgi:hypothetical protein
VRRSTDVDRTQHPARGGQLDETAGALGRDPQAPPVGREAHVVRAAGDPCDRTDPSAGTEDRDRSGGRAGDRETPSRGSGGRVVRPPRDAAARHHAQRIAGEHRHGVLVLQGDQHAAA